MKQGKLVAVLLVGLPFIFTLAYGADIESSKKVDKDDMMAGESAPRTAYELRVKGSGRAAILEQLEKKIKASEEILKAGECTEARRGKTKTGASLVAYSCVKPNAQTDDFFRSLLTVKGTEDCKKGAPPMTLHTYSYALPPGCKLWYCCGVTTAVPCLIVNPSKPCTSCSSYTY